MQTHVENTPAGEHQACTAEGAIEKIRQHVGTLLSEFEQNSGVTIGTLHPLRAWCWRHSGWLLQRFNVMQALTAWERLHQTPYTGKLVRYGEYVLARIRSATKGKPRWFKSLFLGKSDISDCHIVCTSAGRLVMARSIRRTATAYDPTLVAALRDNPDKHASFLAGKVGSSRKQVQAKQVEATEDQESDIAGSDVSSNEADVISPGQEDIAPAPSSVQLPLARECVA